MGQGNDLDGVRQWPADVHALWLLLRVEPAGCTGGSYRDKRSTQNMLGLSRDENSPLLLT